MKRLALLVIAAACGDGGDPLPIGGGGGGGNTGGTTQPDASVDDGDGGTQVSGRVCLLSSAQLLSSCASTGAGGLTVAIGGQQATTAGDGSFTIARPGGTGLVWRVSGSDIMPSAMRAGMVNTIPAVPVLLYEDMLSATNAAVVAGSGAIIARLTRSNTPLSGAIVSATPTPDSTTFYDAGGALAWGQDATGTAGIAWIPSLAPGTATLLVDTGTGQASVAGVPVYADTVTFELAEIP